LVHKIIESKASYRHIELGTELQERPMAWDAELRLQGLSASADSTGLRQDS
jgi:hypothetical protein